VRYSGKERDATGLYHYGYRYYQPWSGRWLSADPAGTVDGLNLFRMCRNNPGTLFDPKGLAPHKNLSDKKQKFVEEAGLKLAQLSFNSKGDFGSFKNQIREFMESEHSSIKKKRFDILWSFVVSEAGNHIQQMEDNEKKLANERVELGRGGDAVVYDMKNGFVIKEFHNAITELEQKEREVDIFNKVYGDGSASIVSNAMIKMKKIPGIPIAEIGVGSFTQTEADRLMEKLNDLHGKGIYHGDLHYGNILFDGDSRDFNFIDFGTSRVEEDKDVLESEAEHVKTNFINMWPGIKRKTAPSIIGKDGRVYI
ncbi:RHS repeat-associated core domain-containing protein, partial [Enterobacter cloacae complex sp. P31C]|uniref:RHS repeat-associated core domain-containing protein n=1 Tax=Enterobacter cloacae complex sp. P31C TaxID=2779560 RepID=UPI00351C6D45